MTLISPLSIIDIEPSEEWSFSVPQRGSHIRVQRKSGLYYHHGIYISDDEVIHFTGNDDDSILDWPKCEVISTDVLQFRRDGSVEVKIYNDDELNDLYPLEHIIDYARACLGDKGYNLVFNNCEHFANVCTLGRYRSRQVEQFLSGTIPLKEDNNMGLWGWVKGLFSSSSSGGSRSTSNTTYEPDKVKVAEIEASTKIRLANMEIERIELMTQARIDVLKFEAQSNIALEQAKAQGFNVMAQTILLLQEKLNEVAEKRLLIIEKGSLQVIKDIENFYIELDAKIQADDDRYNLEKLPELLSVLEKYDEGTSSHKLYMKRIEEDMALQAKHYVRQLDAITDRQSQIISGFLESKDRIIEQTAMLTAGMLDMIKHQIPPAATTASPAIASLPNQERPALTERKVE